MHLAPRPARPPRGGDRQVVHGRMARLQHAHDIRRVDDPLAAEFDRDPAIHGLDARRTRVIPDGLLTGGGRMRNGTGHPSTLRTNWGTGAVAVRQSDSPRRYTHRPARRTNELRSCSTPDVGAAPERPLQCARNSTMPVASSAVPASASTTSSLVHRRSGSRSITSGRVLGCHERARWPASPSAKAVYRDRISRSAVGASPPRSSGPQHPPKGSPLPHGHGDASSMRAAGAPRDAACPNDMTAPSHPTTSASLRRPRQAGTATGSSTIARTAARPARLAPTVDCEGP
jgi:hypothetical protein